MYDPSVTDLSPSEHELAGAIFNLIDLVRNELEDEDPGKIDVDDVVTVLAQSPGYIMTIFQHVTSDNFEMAKDLEAAVHGVVRNLRVLEGEEEPTVD